MRYSVQIQHTKQKGAQEAKIDVFILRFTKWEYLQPQRKHFHQFPTPTSDLPFALVPITKFHIQRTQ